MVSFQLSNFLFCIFYKNPNCHSRYITIEVDEELQWLAWELNTDESGVEYSLADVIVRYVKIGVKDLS